LKISEIKRVIFPHIVKDSASGDVEIEGFSVSSGDVKKGFMFFAMIGARHDGHIYIGDAFLRGASVVVGEKEMDLKNYIQVDSTMKVLKELSPLFYGNPQNKMDFIGVTGTNGKTTTSYMIEHILRSKRSVGVIGTVEYRFGGRSLKAPNTTPFPWSWYKLLSNMAKAQVRTVVAEVSSHALQQGRIEKTMFDVVVFTNFTRDHMDFHGDEESYFRAKSKLFTDYAKSGGLAVINLDDRKGTELLKSLESLNTITYGVRNSRADLNCISFVETEYGISGVLEFKGSSIDFYLPMSGFFNLYNMMAAVAAVSDYVTVEEAVELLKKDVSVPGRMERVGKWGRIYLDYAHTPDALENILKSLSEIKKSGRIITLFGAGGDRDKGKRILMGESVSKYSDVVFLTSDNPRSEDPRAIIEDVRKGIHERVKLYTILNRDEAIREAIQFVSKDDILVVAGKGHEDYQLLKDGKIYFSDRDEILKNLEDKS